MVKWPSYGFSLTAVAPSQFEFETPALKGTLKLWMLTYGKKRQLDDVLG